jgi:hypothetical protein
MCFADSSEEIQCEGLAGLTHMSMGNKFRRVVQNLIETKKNISHLEAMAGPGS